MKSINVTRQQGSAHVIVIVILAVALIGAIGYIFWNNFIQPKPADTATASRTAVTSSPSPSLAATQDKDTLTIAAWKVKFTIPESLKSTSIKYIERKQGNDTYYGVTTARIVALGGNCTTMQYGESIKFYRTKDKPSAMYDAGYVVDNSATDGYYYVVSETIPACSGSYTDPNVKTNQVEIDDRIALIELLKSVKSVQ